jgi:hypothetical protein
MLSFGKAQQKRTHIPFNELKSQYNFATEGRNLCHVKTRSHRENLRDFHPESGGIEGHFALLPEK